MIFGYGDETDEQIKKMEKWRKYGYLKYVKTFWYSRTSNYFNFIRFIESEPFQVYVWGHSCGSSDRTMLNTIFEHSHCRSIKLFYHDTGVKNNFNELVEDVAMLFNDKKLMRQKLVPFSQSQPMPQVI